MQGRREKMIKFVTISQIWGQPRKSTKFRITDTLFLHAVIYLSMHGLSISYVNETLTHGDLESSLFWPNLWFDNTG